MFFSISPTFRSARLLLKTAGAVACLVSVGIAPVPANAMSVARSPGEMLERIILPSVEFHQTKLSDALEFLRQAGARYNPEPNPSNRQINIILSSAVPGTTNPPINLTLRQIPLSEALRYVASQAGLKLRVEAYAVSLVPVTENTDSLVTATFRVSPAFFGNQTGVGVGKNTLGQGATSAQ